jgi:hypothetical protein
MIAGERLESLAGIPPSSRAGFSHAARLGPTTGDQSSKERRLREGTIKRVDGTTRMAASIPVSAGELGKLTPQEARRGEPA